MSSLATAFLRPFLPVFLALALGVVDRAAAQAPPTGDPNEGMTIFTQNCALCHAAALGPGNIEIDGQGPSLAGVVGRKAAGAVSYPYSAALIQSGLTWDAPTLDKFLTNPGKLVPGTKMMIAVPEPLQRSDVIAFLQTLKLPASVKPAAPRPDGPVIPPAQD